MNKFKKYAPNVFVAECEEKYNKGDLIFVATKYGEEIECKVFNFLETKDELFYYSIIRTGDSYEKKKKEKFERYSYNANERSKKYIEESKEGKDFLILGEPIKVGHHSEKKVRALIERNENRIRKSIKETEKSENYQDKANFWENKEKEITLAIPESLEYFSLKLEEAKKFHKGLKDGSIPKKHSYSVVYANKEVKNLTKKVEIAKKLWK